MPEILSEKNTADATLLYNNFTKCIRDWIQTNRITSTVDINEVMLSAISLMAASQVVATAKMNGIHRDQAQELMLMYMDAAYEAVDPYKG